MTLAREQPSRTRFYIPELDGVRFFAFLAVLMLHAIPPPFDFATIGGPTGWRWWVANGILSGAFGVDLFFVLSSFLITSLLLREQEQRGQIDVLAFWTRRILRIWPLYYGLVLVCWVLEDLPANIALSFLALAGNWGLLVYPLPRNSNIGPLWSVSIEEQFYLFWPLLLAFLPRRSLRPVCLAMIAVAFVLRVWLLATGGGVANIWMNTFARLDAIGVGALIALAYRQRPIVLGRAGRTALAVAAPVLTVATTGLLTTVVLVPGFGGAGGAGFPVRAGLPNMLLTSLAFLVVALCCGAVVILALSGRSWLSHPVLVYLGGISYGLYVFHRLAINIVDGLWWPWRFTLSFVISVVLAALSYRFFERPFLRLKERRFTHVRSAPPPTLHGEEAGPAADTPTPQRDQREEQNDLVSRLGIEPRTP